MPRCFGFFNISSSPLICSMPSATCLFVASSFMSRSEISLLISSIFVLTAPDETNCASMRRFDSCNFMSSIFVSSLFSRTTSFIWFWSIRNPCSAERSFGAPSLLFRNMKNSANTAIVIAPSMRISYDGIRSGYSEQAKKNRRDRFITFDHVRRNGV